MMGRTKSRDDPLRVTPKDIFIATGVALKFAFSARSVSRQHVDAALSAYLLAGVFLAISTGFLRSSGRQFHFLRRILYQQCDLF